MERPAVSFTWPSQEGARSRDTITRMLLLVPLENLGLVARLRLGHWCQVTLLNDLKDDAHAVFHFQLIVDLFHVMPDRTIADLQLVCNLLPRKAIEKKLADRKFPSRQR